MLKTDLVGYMEFKSFLPDSNLNSSLLNLVKCADLSQIHTFGWPIAPVINDIRFKPVPFGNGIKCLIRQDDMFDYWTLKSNGEFYVLCSLFEDTRGGGKLYFDTRIIRTMETFWRTARLYKQMGVGDDAIVACELEYGGLSGRRLEAANPMRIMTIPRVCRENVFSQKVTAPISQLLFVDGLVKIVQEYCHSLFQSFDFFDLRCEHTDQIARLYFAGRTS